MKPSDDLHALIQSLDKNEKRYCQLYLHAGTRKNGPKFQRLFAEIARQPAYDEEAIKEAFQGEPWLASLSAEKGALLQAILEALAAYGQPTPSEQVQLMLRDARILRDRGLFQQAAKRLDKAAALAAHHQAFLDAIHVHNAQRHLIKEQVQKGRKERVEASWKATKEALKALNQEMDLFQLRDQLFLLGRQEFVLRGEATRAQVETWMQSPHLQPGAILHGFQAHVSSNFIGAIYHQLLGQFDQAHACFLRNKHTWEAHPARIADQPAQFLTAMANYLHSACLVGDYEAIPPALGQLQALKPKDWNQEAEIFQNHDYYLLLYFLNRFELRSALGWIPQIVVGLEKYAAKINGARRLAFYYNFAMAYFLAEDFREAKRWFARILDGSESENRQDIRQMARIMVIICHLELGDDDLLDALFQSAYRHLRRRDRLHEAEKMLFQHLRGVIQSTAMHQRRAKLSIMADAVADLLAQKGAARPPGAQEIAYWLQSRLQSTSIAAIAKSALVTTTS
jgi:hypothetical protein